MHSKLLTLVLAIGVAGGTASCAQDDENRDPVTPSPSVTEVFAGALARNGGRTHDFSVAATGSVQARQTAVAAESARSQMRLAPVESVAV